MKICKDVLTKVGTGVLIKVAKIVIKVCEVIIKICELIIGLCDE